MSTKIYDAYLWNGTIEELMDFLRKFKNALIIEASNYLFSISNEIEDKLQKRNAKRMLQNDREVYIEDILFEASQDVHYNPLDTSGCVVVYFNQGRIAVQFFGINKPSLKPYQKLGKIIENFPKLKNYEYWNNVDIPDNISREEWEERAKFWEFLDIPAENGLVYDMQSMNFISKVGTRYERLRRRYEP